jgi:SWI/SNF-related matrix-associated actin-dependent regulator 1 of chromatin subfamily A
MFTPKQLTDFNNFMLSGGVPDCYDKTGYNKPDFSVCMGYLDILTNSQLADLSSRLVKYCNTQLHINQEEMAETANYYNSLTNNTQLSTAISIKIRDNFTELAFDYNWEYVSIIKKAKNRKYISDSKTWYVHNSEIIAILDKLQSIEADCKASLEYLQNNPIITETEKPKPVITTIKVTENNNKLTLSSPYHAEIITAIKSLCNRKYEPNTKSWIIPIEEVQNLIPKLEKIKEIDFSQLFQYNNIIPEVQELKIIIPDNMTKIPFEHQIVAANFLLNKKKAILADEMGGGKTFSAILAANNIQGKKLIVCPASLKLNWQKEINFIPEQITEVINGKGWIDCNGWTIVNYDILCKHIDKILESNFSVVIFDEIHYCKAVSNSGKASSKRAEMFLRIAEKVENIYLLTGTPITNHTKDIFNLLKAVKHPLAKKFFAFGQRYCNAYNNGYGWDFNGSSNTEELHEKIKHFMMRRLKSEMLDLPEKIRTFIPVQIKLTEYNKKIKEYMNNRKSMSNQGEHLVYLNAMRHILAKEKVCYTIDIAKNLLEQGQKIVILTNYNFVVEKLIEEFGNIAVKLTGDCNQEQRQKAVEDFQNGNKKVFIGNLIAAGVGITLTASQNIIVNDYDWVPANHAQGEDRIHRIGQEKIANIQYIYASQTFDENITQLLEKKLNNISQIVDGKEDSFLGELIEII